MRGVSPTSYNSYQVFFSSAPLFLTPLPFFVVRPAAARPLCLARHLVFFQSLDVEGIHRDLFALREAKLALDKAVALAPELHSRAASDAGGGGAATADHRERRKTTPFAATAMTTMTTTTTARGRAKSRADGASAAAAARASAGGGQTGRPRGRRALAEVQVDPDLPLPLPAFPGYGKLVGIPRREGQNAPGSSSSCSNNSSGVENGVLPGGRVGAKGNGGGGHGYFVPGLVVPRQRQSHGLPQELRAIATVPKPERLPGASGRRSRVRPRQGVPSAGRGTRAPEPPAPRPPRVSAGNGVSPSSQLRKPGSAVAVAAAREQRRLASRAVDELRKEMREREERFERELEQLRRVRLRRGAATAPGVVAGRAAPAAAPSGPGRTVTSTKSSGVPGKLRLRANRRQRGRGRATTTMTRAAAVAAAAPDGETDSSARVRSRPGSDEQVDADCKRGEDSGRGAERRVETADAQAQTGVDGQAQIFLPPPPPPPAVHDTLKGEEERRRGTGSPVSGGGAGRPPHRDEMRGADAAMRSGHDGFSFASSSSGEEGVGRPPGVFPPPPVVFLEGEGRNAAWLPSDDNRLLEATGGRGGAAAAVGTGARGHVDQAEALLEVLEGGEGRLVVAARCGEDGVAGAPARVTRVTAGRLEAGRLEAASGPAGQDGGWVELAGMLALSAVATAAEGAEGEAPPEEGEMEKPPSTEASTPAVSFSTPTVSPELLDLMREVVGQQKVLGEERSALMEVSFVSDFWC